MPGTLTCIFAKDAKITKDLISSAYTGQGEIWDENYLGSTEL